MASKSSSSESEAVETTTGGEQTTYAAKVAKEYGQLVAVGPLDWFGARAFNEGDPVPASHPGVPGWLADESVRSADTKA